MPTDPILRLQIAARSAAAHITPGLGARRVIVLGDDEKRLLDIAVLDGPHDQQTSSDDPLDAKGWRVTDRRAFFDGKPVPVGISRIPLLKVLIEADGPLHAKELAKLAFDRQTDEENARYHIKTLRKELSEGLPDFEGDILPGDGGYRLVLK